MSPLLLRFLLLMVSGSVMVAGQGCTANCTYNEPGDLVPNPMDCQTYYICLADDMPLDVPSSCDDGWKFDETTSQCLEDVEGTEITCAFCPNTCIFGCGVDDGSGAYFRADPSGNCGQYLLCGMGGPAIVLDCATENPYFDGEVCQADIAKCCDPCRVYCDTAYTEVSDPYDCTKFYYCPDEKYYPDENDQFTCPDGEKFDSEQGHCDVMTECIQPCAGRF